MSIKYLFSISLFLFTLVILNIYFFYTLNTNNKPTKITPLKSLGKAPNIAKDIYEHVTYLPSHYRVKNSQFIPIQKDLELAFNTGPVSNLKHLWNHVKQWSDDESFFPDDNRHLGQILRAISSSQITLVDNAPKGTQLKLLFTLEGKQKLLFKPKRYNLTDIISGHVYAGFDRHNSEVFAYYLAILLKFRWIAPSVIRRINFEKEIMPFATSGLKKTMVKNDKGSMCIYGKCYYCKVNETVCPDSKGELEGAAILYSDKQFRVHKSPWRRSYSSKKMEWEKDNNFCKKVSQTLSQKRILNLIDVAIFDFLIQNGDRHRYEVYKDKIVLFDNGKGMGNPNVDVLDILAPLYQCCMITQSTWKNLELLSGGSLTNTIKLLASFQREKLVTEDHYQAVERRLLQVYATVMYCFEKHGKDKVLKNIIVT